MRALLALLALGLTGAAAPAAVPNDSRPYWTSDGKQIAFQREAPRLDDAHVIFTPATTGDEADIVGSGLVRGWRPGARELLVGLDGYTSIRDASDRQLATVQGSDATWSPDGSHIAYLRGQALSVADSTGANAQQVADGISLATGDATGPVWSRDGTQLAVATSGGLTVFQADGSGSQVVDTGAAANPSWSANGSWLAFERDAAIWIVHPNGTGATQVLGGAPGYHFPQWAPSGDRLAYVRGTELAVVTVGERPQTLIAGVDPSSPPSWSPDGSQLAVAAAGECKRYGIYVLRSQAPAQPQRRSNQCRFDGTSGNDYIEATPYLDFVNGLGGNDRIVAGNGDDTVTGGAGNDGVSGGPGNDDIDGGAGNDILSGGTGNDVIRGGPGRDKIGCGPGRDIAYIGPGDTVRDCERVVRVKK
jgi:Tol biopolymer transport system component